MLKYCMSPFGLWLRQYIDKKNIKPSELAARMGVSPGQVSQLFSGNRGPGRKTIEKLSIALGLSAGDLHAIAEGRDPFTHHEPAVESAKLPKQRIPVLAWNYIPQLKEGLELYAPEFIEDWIPYDMHDKGTFALRVKDVSMEPEYKAGDTIVVNPRLTARVGDDIIAKLNTTDIYFRRLKKMNGVVLLSPLNLAYEDLIISGEDLKEFRIVGVVEAFMRRTRKRRAS